MSTHRVAIVGTGFGVRTQLPGFRAAGGYEIVSLTGSDPEKTRRLAAEHGVPHALTDPAEALRAGEPDLICVTTPPSLHRDMGIASLEAGCHCLMEKPMAMNASEADELTAAAERSGRIALIDHELRAIPNRQELRRRILAGDIGRPLHARVNFTSHFRARPGATWNWWASTAHGGGLLGALGSHVVDMLRWCLGDIATVRGRLTTSITELPDASGQTRSVETDDGVDLLARTTGGCEVSIQLTSVAHHYEGIRWEMHGTEGSLWLEPDGTLHAASRSSKERSDVSLPDPLGESPILDGSEWARGFVHLANALRESLTSGVPPQWAASFEDGQATQRVLDAARASHVDGGHEVILG